MLKRLILLATVFLWLTSSQDTARAQGDDPKLKAPNPAAAATQPQRPAKGVFSKLSAKPQQRSDADGHCPLAPGDIEAEAYYKSAMARMAEGKPRQARRLFQLVINRYGQSRYGPAAKKQLAALDSGYNPAADPTGVDTNGRAELIIGNSMLWSGLGALWPLLVAGEDGADQAMLWSGLGNGVAAGVGSYLLTRNAAIPDGYAHMHHFAQIWGAGNGALIYLLADPKFDADSPRPIAGAILGGAAAGLTASLIFKDGLSIPRGEAEFISSASMWANMLGLFTTILAWGDDINVRAMGGMMLGLGNAAMVAAAFLRPPWSKTRMRYISLIAYGGVLLGNAITASATPDDIRVYGGVSLATLAVGIGLGVLITSGMADAGSARADAPSAPALFAYGDGKFSLGTPLPRVTAHRIGNRTVMGGHMDLLAGTF